MTCSSLTGDNIPQVWKMVAEHRAHMESRGQFTTRRKQQALDWMRELISVGLEDLFRSSPVVSRRLPEITEAVRRGETTAFAAARELLALFVSKE
jgi:LAO/AO transport system kinase